MFLAHASTKRPIAMTCLLIALIALGLNAYRKIPIEQMPAVSIPYAVIATTWVGASSQDIEKDITKRIEDAVSGIDGLKTIESSSMENISRIQLEFSLGIDIDIAAQDIREKVDTILANLPKGADRPVIQKININAAPVVTLFLTGDLPINDLYEYAKNSLSDTFSSVSGVGEVRIIGGNEREIWIELDRARLAAAGLSSMDVCKAVQGGILNLPSGNVREQGNEISVRFDAEYQSVDEISAVEIASAHGARIKLRDIGTVRQAAKEIRERAALDGRTGIIMKVVKKGEGNTVAVVNETRKRFTEVKPHLPGGMHLDWVSDDATMITDVVDSTLTSIYVAILLCAGILFIFLFNIPTTVIVGITMPITMVISLFFMKVFGQTLNMVTLMAIGLSTGVLVSNSIVVLENIVSKLETLHDRWEAARIGTSEMTVAVLASAGTNVVVMFPIAMMTSIAGRFLVPFAITTLIVNAVSIFISFTLTPILSALFLKPASQRRQTFFSRTAKKVDTLLHVFGTELARFLRFLAAYRTVNLLIVLGFVVAFIATLHWSGSRIGFNFLELEDQARITVRLEMPPYYALSNTIYRTEGIAQKLSSMEGTVKTLVTVGKALAATGQADTGVYLSQIELFLTPKSTRPWTVLQRCTEIRTLLARETDCRVNVGVLNSLGARAYGLEYILTGDNLETLATTSSKIILGGSRIYGMDSIESTMRDFKPEIRILPNRPVMSDLKILPSDLAMLVRANIDGLQVADYRRGDRTYKIRVKLAEEPGKEQIRQFLLPAEPGKPIPLEAVAAITESKAPPQIYRYNKSRGAKILGDIQAGISMSSIAQHVLDMIHTQKMLPDGYQFEVGGDGRRMADTNVDFAEAILLSTFLTFLTLCAILESWSRPFLVLLTLPMGLIGVLLALVLTGNNFNILVLLGILMLIGIVVNAAILIVDKMQQFIQQGRSHREAMFEALVDQFRPVLMVVLASGLGMIPLALDSGLGSENRIGIGIASVGGVIVAGLLTITVLPLCYTLFMRKSTHDEARDRLTK